MKNDDKSNKSIDGQSLQSNLKRKPRNSQLIQNSSLIKSIQQSSSKNKNAQLSASKAKESTILPELPDPKQKNLQILDRPLAKKLPSQQNVTTCLEVEKGEKQNLIRKTEKINLDDMINNGNKSKKKKDPDNNLDGLSVDSPADSYEELKEDNFSGSEGPKKSSSNSKSLSLSQHSKMQYPKLQQATKNLKLQMELPSRIKESERENLSSEAVSPFSPQELKIQESSPLPANQKDAAFKLNIQAMKKPGGNSSNQSEVTAQSKATEKEKQKQLEEDIKAKLKQEVLKAVGGPEPLFELTHKYAEGSDSPMWKKKQMRNRTLITQKDQFDNAEIISQESVSLSDGEEGSDLPGDQMSEKSDGNNMIDEFGDKKKKRKTKRNKAIQEKLVRCGEKILVQTQKAINVENHKETFGYLIYDGYRPSNLAQTRDYLEFLTKSSEQIGSDILQQDATPMHILDYMERDLGTLLPEDVNQKHILRFDQNFECGNLDSAYLHNPQVYNLLLKVDSNTRGNTYWFYFGVQNFRVGQRYTFNIYNFTRSMEKFYKDGMNVLVKSEKLNANDNDGLNENTTTGTFQRIQEETESKNSDNNQNQEDQNESSPNQKADRQKKEIPKIQTTGLQQDDRFSDWRYGQCENCHFEIGDIPRIKNLTNMQKYQMSSKDKERHFYGKLTFSYKFKPEDANKKVLFAYALPYTYSNLLQDLEEAKKSLMKVISGRSHSLESPDTVKPDNIIDQIHKTPATSPMFRIIDKTDILDNDKFRNLSNFHNDKQVHTGQVLNESPLEIDKNGIAQGQSSHGGKNSTDSNRKIRHLNAKKLSYLNDKNQSGAKINVRGQQTEYVHEQIKKQGTELMNFKTSKFEQEFIRDQAKGNNNLKDLFWNEAAKNELPLSQQHNFEITNDYLQYRQEVIAQSMGGLNIFQITLTKRRKAGSIAHKKKQVIYIQARVHAAETHGSFIMSSIIKEFSQNYMKYDQMLQSHIIKLVPMLNPDGVVLGNSRSSLAGVDLNRRWSNPNATMHPELYFLKMSMRETKRESEGIAIFCDLHGHNKQYNCFIYGCNKAPNEGLLSWTKTRLLPKIYASYEPIFDFNMSKFSQEKTKYNTARVVVWNEFKVTNSFTLETSQFGMKADQSPGKITKRREACIQLEKENFDDIGLSLLKSFCQFIFIETKLKKELKWNGGWFKKKTLDQVTGQSARSKLDQMSSNNSQGYYKNKSLSNKQVAPSKKSFLPSRHNTSDNLMIQNKLAKKKKIESSRDVLAIPIQNDKIEQPKTTNAINTKQFTQKKVSIRLASSDDGSIDSKSQRNIETSNFGKLSARNTNKDQNKKARNASTNIKREGSFRNANTVQSELNSSPFKKEEQSSQGGASQMGSPIKLTNFKKSLQIQPANQFSKTEMMKKESTQSTKKRDKAKDDQMQLMPECLAQYFSKNEYDDAYSQSKKPIEKVVIHQPPDKEAESDSEPSCDNFEVNEMQQIFSEALSEEDIQEIFNPEQNTTNERPVAENTNNFANNGDLNVVIEQVSEHDEHLESQTGTKSQQQSQRQLQQIQAQEQQDQDTDRLRDQIKSIQEYQQIAQQLKSAQMESKQLADKFDKLSKQLNQQMSIKTKNIPIQQVQLFRGGWNEIQGQNHNQNTQLRNSNLNPIDQIQENQNRMKSNQPLPAGPMSGESKSGERQRKGNSTHVNFVNQEQGFVQNSTGTNFPAISNAIALEQRRGVGGMATSQAKANKYKSRNNILNMSSYNMENGLQISSNKPTSLIGNMRSQQAQVHVHPEFARNNQMMQKPGAQNFGGNMILGQSIKQNATNSPNYNTTSKKNTKNMAGMHKRGQQQDFKNSVTVSNYDQNIQNFNAALRNDFVQRNQIQNMPFNETIKTNSTKFSRDPTTQSGGTKGQSRRMIGENNRVSSLPISEEKDVNSHISLLQSDTSQSFAPSNNDQQVKQFQNIQYQNETLRKDVQTSPGVNMAEYHLNSSLEWVQTNENQIITADRGLITQSAKMGQKQGHQSDSSHLRVDNLKNLNRQRRTSPKNIIYQGSPGNKLRQDIFNKRNQLENNAQNPFYMIQVENSVNNQINQQSNDYNEDFNQLNQLNASIHGALNGIPQTQPKRHSRKLTMEMKQNELDIIQDSQQDKTRFSVQLQTSNDKTETKKSHQMNNSKNNFFQNENVKQYLQHQQIILKPHQIRKVAVDQVQNIEQINQSSINKRRRVQNSTKVVNDSTFDVNNKDGNMPQHAQRDHNSMLVGNPKNAQRIIGVNNAQRTNQSNLFQQQPTSANLKRNKAGLSPQNHQYSKTKQSTDQMSPIPAGLFDQKPNYNSQQNADKNQQKSFNQQQQISGNGTVVLEQQTMIKKFQNAKTVLLSPMDLDTRDKRGRNEKLQNNQLSVQTQQQTPYSHNELLSIKEFPAYRGQSKIDSTPCDLRNEKEEQNQRFLNSGQDIINSNFSQKTYQNPIKLSNQGQSKRYGSITNQQMGTKSPTQYHRGYGPNPVDSDFGIQSVAYMVHDSKAKSIIMSPRPQMSQTPGQISNSKIGRHKKQIQIRVSDMNEKQSPSWVAGTKQFQDVYDSRRMNTQSDHTDIDLLNPASSREQQPASSGRLHDRTKMVQFEFKTNSAMEDRFTEVNTQETMSKKQQPVNVKGIQSPRNTNKQQIIQDQRQQVQNILKSNLQRNNNQ